MLVEVKVPMLAESVAEATLMTWHKQPGDPVQRGDSLIDIETDKVTLEVAAPNNGVLVDIIRQNGENVTSDEVIAHIDTEAAAGDSKSAETSAAAAAEPARPSTPQQQELPVLNEAHEDELPKMSPAARNMIENFNLDASEIRDANSDGRLTREDVQNYMDETGVDATAAGASSSSAQPDNTGTQQAKTAPADDTTATQPPAESTPRAPETEQPTAAATSEPSSAAPATTPETAATPVTKTTVSGRSEERVKMTRLRQRVAERLLSAQHENAILTTFNEVNMKPVMDLRERYKEEFEKTHGVRLGFMSFFTKAAVEALKKFPVVNASVDGTDILYHNYFDIGIAVSSPRGLVVPIVRDADTLSLARVESTIRELGEKAQQATLTMEDLTGGTFTITNGGIFGSLLSTPILNPPQSAILGMHKIQERPVAEHGEVVIRPMMYLALSYDHRIIDGREAVQFLVTVKEQLEDPARLLLQI